MNNTPKHTKRYGFNNKNYKNKTKKITKKKQNKTNNKNVNNIIKKYFTKKNNNSKNNKTNTNRSYPDITYKKKKKKPTQSPKNQPAQSPKYSLPKTNSKYVSPTQTDSDDDVLNGLIGREDDLKISDFTNLEEKVVHNNVIGIYNIIYCVELISQYLTLLDLFQLQSTSHSTYHKCQPFIQQIFAQIVPNNTETIDINRCNAGMLNQDIINIYLGSLQYNNNKKICILQTTFYTKLMNDVNLQNKKPLKKFLKKTLNIFESTDIIIPIHGKLHWSLVRLLQINNVQNRWAMYHFDSQKDSFHKMQQIKQYIDHLLYLQYQIHDKSNEYTLDARFVDCEQQNNSFDCGVYLLCFAERIALDAPKQIDIGGMRMVLKLMMLNYNRFLKEQTNVK